MPHSVHRAGSFVFSHIVHFQFCLLLKVYLFLGEVDVAEDTAEEAQDAQDSHAQYHQLQQEV